MKSVAGGHGVLLARSLVGSRLVFGVSACFPACLPEVPRALRERHGNRNLWGGWGSVRYPGGLIVRGATAERPIKLPLYKSVTPWPPICCPSTVTTA